MLNISGVKKIKDVMISEELIIYDKAKRGRDQNSVLDAGREYIVPEYQREIKWSTENVQVLLDDLLKGSKFLGTITLSTHEPKHFEIIDGQQRLTVITIIITCLNERVAASKRLDNLCKIVNKSFPDFNEALKYGFDYEKIKEQNLPLYNQILANDTQKQKMEFTRIWNGVVERVDLLTEDAKEELLLALGESEVNVIVNEIEGTDTQKKFCVDYFIDINNKSVELDSLDIIRAYAFKEDFMGMKDRWVTIQNKCNELSGKVKYSREELYFQYFVCRVNAEIEYQISKLSNDYRIKENVVVHGKKFAAGTYIWNMFKNEKFYSKLLNELVEYLKFIEIVIGSETGGENDFKEFFKDESGKLIDETRILNAHTILNSILRNDDTVPKMMVMKYFLEVLKPEKTKKNKYRIISKINVIATVFTLSSLRKSSGLIASRILAKDWDMGISEYAAKIYQSVPLKMGYDKEIKENGALTKDSGLHAARRYFSMMDSCSITTGGLSFNEEVFKIENITFGDKNMEHFLVNRELTYSIYLEDGQTVDVEISLPKRFEKQMTNLANYLLMDSDKNRKLMNRPVFEKIEMIEDFIDSEGIDHVIPSMESQNHYYLIKKFMHDESRYPHGKILEATTKEDKQKILKEYYTKHFEDEYKLFTRGLTSADARFLARMEYYLKKMGFFMDQDCMTIEVDSIFANVSAQIDEKDRKIIMSFDLYNPYVETENSQDDYANLVNSVMSLFVDKYGEQPEMHTSAEYCPDCPEENVSFVYELEPDEKKVRELISVLQEISENIA